MLRTIALHHINTYRAIKKSGHPVLKQDAELRRAMTRFERRLTQEKKRQQQAKAEKNASYLRSYGNLKGVWQTNADSEERISFSFTSKTHLRVTHTKAKKSRTFEGQWKSDHNHITFTVIKTINRSENSVAHARTISVILSYRINHIDRQNMTLFDTRRKKKIELNRTRR